MLPGTLAGAHLAGLLFFLNPTLPFRFAPLVRGVLVYAALLGGASLLVHLPWLLRARRAPPRFLPWSLAAVLLAFAVLDAAQASFYAYYLPAGINVRLLKAAAWLALAGLIVLYVAFAHGWTGRRYGRASRWTIAVVALLSLYALVERRESFQPRPEPTPLGAVVEGQRQVELYVVGIDGATLDALLPLTEQGRLPFLAAMLREGSYARLRSLTPTRAQPLWMTLATGKHPHRHGVVANQLEPAPFLFPGAELQLVPAGVGFTHWGTFGAASRPVDKSQRRALATWEILARLGGAPTVVGWPEATPAPPGVAFALSEAFFAGQPGQVSPPEIEAMATVLRMPVVEADPALLRSLGDRLPPSVHVGLEQDLWRERVAAALLDRQRSTTVDPALFLRLPGLRQASRRWFGGFVAHDLEGEQSARAADAARRVEAYYRHLDDSLASLWARARGPRLFAVISPYGATTPSNWRRALTLGRLPVEGVLTGRADGVLLLRGEGIRAGSFVGEAGIADVAPTLLYGLGLPVGRDMDGRALTGVFEPSFLATHPLSFVPSYETLTR
ncbi:MAG TPA: alkaline phosphatase family protein [Thermoanaerobaculia bacterium]|nr:alkaline phosphatase family protein [Thermoanaerobaculia bacterium]